MQRMLSFTNRPDKHISRRAPCLTTLMTPPTDMPWNFKTPSLLMIYGRTLGMESLILKKKKALQVGRLLHCDAAPCLSIGNQVICHITVHKHLGVLLMQDLKWSNHIIEVIAKATRKAGLLRFMMHNLNDSQTILKARGSPEQLVAPEKVLLKTCFSHLARPLQHQRTLFIWGDANSQ